MLCCVYRKFQLTSSRRGWLPRFLHSLPDLYFNSHPHEEDDDSLRLLNCHTDISTHILTKRMTIYGTTNRTATRTFQLTSSRRGWLTILIWRRMLWYFNSHPHEEDDRFRFRKLQAFHYFNSHPHEEDDNDKRKGRGIWKYFNSHPHEEDDGVVVTGGKYPDKFQLTSSRRGWRFWDWDHRRGYRFQLTSSRRGWLDIHNNQVEDRKFQLTSSRRGWPFLSAYTGTALWYFNSHPHEEDDNTRCCTFPTYFYFNSHPHEEDDSAHGYVLTSHKYFNSHPHEEDDPLYNILFHHPLTISTHILTKRMTQNNADGSFV